MKKLAFIFIVLMTMTSFAQFKMPKKKDWEISNTKPIVVLQLDEDDKNAAIFNNYVKKYAEEIFGTSRIEKYLNKKEFDKFIKGNKEKYNFIGFKYHLKEPFTFTNVFFGICGKAFMINGGYLMTYNYNYDEKKSTFFKTKFQLISEADIKFALKSFKTNIEKGVQQEDLSMSEMMKQSKNTSLKSMNPNSNKLKELTLLIDKDMLSEEMVKQFKSEYNYKYEFVDKARIEKTMLENEKGYAFMYEHYKPLSIRHSDDIFEYHYYSILYYIYSSENYEQLFFYVPDVTSPLENRFKVGGTKKENMLTNDDYVKDLNSVIE